MNKCNKTIIDQFYGNNTLVVMDFYFNILMTNFAFDIYSFTYTSTYNYTNLTQNIVLGSNLDTSLPFSTV